MTTSAPRLRVMARTSMGHIARRRIEYRIRTVVQRRLAAHSDHIHADDGPARHFRHLRNKLADYA